MSLATCGTNMKILKIRTQTFSSVESARERSLFTSFDASNIYFYSSHWYLAVICFPGKDRPTVVSEINEEDDESDTKVLVFVRLEVK